MTDDDVERAESRKLIEVSCDPIWSELVGRALKTVQDIWFAHGALYHGVSGTTLMGG